MEKYTLAIVLTSCFIAVITTGIKRIIKKKKKTVNDSFLRVCGITLSFIATVLSWWILKIPEEFKGCVLYMFPVYVLQEILDLDVIKRIIKAFIKAKLKKQGVEENIDFKES